MKSILAIAILCLPLIALASPTDCGFLPLNTMIHDATDIAIVNVTEFTVDTDSMTAALHATVKDPMKGEVRGTISINMLFPVFHMAPCVGPDTETGEAIVFLTRTEDGFELVGGDRGVIHHSRDEYSKTVRRVRIVLHN